MEAVRKCNDTTLRRQKSLEPDLEVANRLPPLFARKAVHVDRAASHLRQKQKERNAISIEYTLELHSSQQA
jgi:hypothetical protein